MTPMPQHVAHDRVIQVHAFDIQALVGSGFAPLTRCTYHLLQVEHRARACRWLRDVLSCDLVKSVADLGRRTDASGDPGAPAAFHRPMHDEAVAVAFSREGLRRFGVVDTATFPFPTAFEMGMTDPDRARLLGDADAASWDWGDHPGALRTRPSVHLLVAHFRRTDDVDEAGPFGSAAFAREASGLRVVRAIRTCPSYTEVDGRGEARSYEPFGFRDGLAQPVVDGLRDFDRAPDASKALPAQDLDDRIQPGEFVLGHRTEYDEPSYCPDVDGWDSRATIDGLPSAFGLNGTYLAVRQIVQHVDAFRAFERAHPEPGGGPTVAERMIGRRKNGAPLVTSPSEPRSLNDFRYRMDDADGFQCPVGAHIRRANPRDTLGWDIASGVRLSKRHRILRRGRVFTDGCTRTDCGEPRHRDRCGRGILFIAVNADLERQFELIQKRWLNNTSFNRYAAADPLVGSTGPADFSIPDAETLAPHVVDFGPFTRVVGGGYFFLPGLTALRFIASRA